MKKRRNLLNRTKSRNNTNTRRRVMKKNISSTIAARNSVFRLRIIEEMENQEMSNELSQA